MRFDQLPVWAQHLIIAYATTFGLSMFTAIGSNGGVWPFPWADAFQAAVNSAAVSTAAVVVMWLTRLTAQYGKGSAAADQVVPPAPAPPKSAPPKPVQPVAQEGPEA